MTMPAEMNQEGERRKRPKWRKLRIAFSAICGVLCLLLIALWARSYWWANIVIFVQRQPNFVLTHGHLFYDANYAWTGQDKRDFIIHITPDVAMEIQDIWNPDALKVQVFSYKQGLPIWPFALCTAAVAVAPWLVWRFSLRTLLIAMTLIAVLLGLIAISK